MRVLVIADHPYFTHQSDGLMGRVRAIDSLFRSKLDNVQLDYLQIVFKEKSSIRSSDMSNSKYFRLNVFRHLNLIIKHIKEYDVIYIHSLYNFVRLFPFIIFSKHLVVADMHGVVPEEEKEYGRAARSVLYSVFERLMMYRADLSICVTNSMILHFSNKYSFKKRYILLPIFDDSLFNNADHFIEVRQNIAIYAGGLQPWQNIPMVIESDKALKRHQYTLACYIPKYQYSEAEEELLENIKRAGLYKGSLNKSELHALYRRAKLGLLLRSDSIVNRVASPTKLFEYISFGIVPIVLQQKIGDFEVNGYQAVRFSDVMAGKMPTSSEIESMSEHNTRRFSVELNAMKNGADSLFDFLQNPKLGKQFR